MKDIENIGVPKGEGVDSFERSKIIIDSETLDEVLELLEDSMEHGETYLSHDKVRPSGHIMAMNVKSVYQILVKAHSNYDLTKKDE